jgi:hypothetical protein
MGRAQELPQGVRPRECLGELAKTHRHLRAVLDRSVPLPPVAEQPGAVDPD